MKNKSRNRENQDKQEIKETTEDKDMKSNS